MRVRGGSGNQPSGDRRGKSWLPRLAPSLEELHGPLVPLGCLAGSKGPEIAAFAGPPLDLPGIEPILAGLQFSNHDPTPFQAAGFANALDTEQLLGRDCPRSIMSWG